MSDAQTRLGTVQDAEDAVSRRAEIDRKVKERLGPWCAVSPENLHWMVGYGIAEARHAEQTMLLLSAQVLVYNDDQKNRFVGAGGVDDILENILENIQNVKVLRSCIKMLNELKASVSGAVEEGNVLNVLLQALVAQKDTDKSTALVKRFLQGAKPNPAYFDADGLTAALLRAAVAFHDDDVVVTKLSELFAVVNQAGPVAAALETLVSEKGHDGHVAALKSLLREVRLDESTTLAGVSDVLSGLQGKALRDIVQKSGRGCSILALVKDDCRDEFKIYSVNVFNALAEKQNADLSGLDLSSADLSNVDLSGANLTGANLTGANVKGVNLSSVDLSNFDLSNFDLSGANLTGANLTGANLTGANLSGANLTDANLTNASGLQSIQFDTPITATNARVTKTSCSIQDGTVLYYSGQIVKSTRSPHSNGCILYYSSLSSGRRHGWIKASDCTPL